MVCFGCGGEKKIIFTIYNRQYTTNAFFMSSRHLTLLLRIQGKPVGIQSSSSPKTIIKSLSTMYSFPSPMYSPPQSHIFARCCASRSTGVTSTPSVGAYWARSRWANRLTNAVLPDFAGPTNPTLNSCFCMVLHGWVKTITPILPWKKMMVIQNNQHAKHFKIFIRIFTIFSFILYITRSFHFQLYTRSNSRLR